ncbi:hypothetical protein BC749_102870 [Flavobacterium araucananum]|uniref:Uncharacterized protein n=1 Tax=Flavobacterium araucananum TaxID=946678 RepID=A0A227P474_9FLAO|nr:hypothetical protein [Flavobacterium araucananum]OXG04184.1 hypothetical protein B0A64_16120 [Flavobacterium araucananum]PWK01294.1 hypothetical protein BC749_102870 [Flavobacterium araucananum]
MALNIKKIENLSLKAELKSVDISKFSHQTEYSETISIALAVTEAWDPQDNIGVIWEEDGKEVIRAVGGTLEKKGKEATISGLESVSKYSFDVNGQLSIGPKDKPDAVSLSVRVGNIRSAKNPKADTIINFSDTEDGATESSIKLNDLVDWIKDKSGDTEVVKFPEKDNVDAAKQPKNFEIVFKKFYYNITQKTFDINVQSKEDNEIKFGAFTITKVGFRVTNTPVTFKEEKKLKVVPTADELSA